MSDRGTTDLRGYIDECVLYASGGLYEMLVEFIPVDEHDQIQAIPVTRYSDRLGCDIPREPETIRRSIRIYGDQLMELQQYQTSAIVTIPAGTWSEA